MESLKLIRSLIVLCLLVMIVYACKTQEEITQEEQKIEVNTTKTVSKFIPTAVQKNNKLTKRFTEGIVLTGNRNSFLEFTFKKSYTFDPNTFFIENKNAFGLGEEDEIKLYDVRENMKKGKSGRTYNAYSYQQYYKDIKIQGARTFIRVYSDNIIDFRGQIVEGLKFNLATIVDEKDVLKTTLDTVKAEEYCWENEVYKKKWETSCEPKIEKFFTWKEDYDKKKNGFSLNGNDYDLLYKVYVSTIKPLTNFWTHIQANTGKLLILRNTEIHQCHSGNANTIYNGLQSLDVYQLNPNFYKLMDFNCRGDWIIPKTQEVWSNSIDCPNVDDCTDIQSTPTGWDGNSFMRKKASALWAVQKSWDYFQNNFSIHGGEKLRLNMETNSCGLSANLLINNETIINIPRDNNSNAASCGSALPYTTWSNFVSLEAIGHEFTHTIDMIDGENVGLNSAGEDKTIMEALSDIFGAMIEINQSSIESYDWLINDAQVSTAAFQRSFANPNDFGYHYEDDGSGFSAIPGQPDFFGQANMTNDFALDIYPETGIINHWFYLLANGGANEVWEDSNNNEIQDPSEESIVYSVNAIPISSIEQILIKLFIGEPEQRFDVLDDFDDFAQKVLLITEDLYDENSSEYCSVVSALRAVNLPVSSADIASLQDYYMQVNPDDYGKEPYQGAYPIWVSEDIYVRNGPDGFDNPTHQNPTYDPAAPNEVDYVYVKVRNRGCQPITDAKLKVYWSRASTGLMWPEHWRGLNLNINGYFEGGLLAGQEMTDLENTIPFQGPVQIDELLPGEVKTYQVEWVVPNPEEFGDIDLHYCMLARIVSDQDPIEVEAEGLWNYVPKNNNVVWKNVTIMEGIDMMGLVGPGSVWVRKLLADDDKLTLRIKSDIPYFLNQGKLYSRITGGGYDKWINASDATSFEELGNFKAEIRKETVDLVFEGLTPGERFTLEIYFKPESDFEQPMKLDVFQIESKQIVGGEQFIIKPTKDMKAKERTFFRESNLDNIVSIFPNPNNGENLKVKINNEKVISEDVLLKIRDLNQQILLEKVVKSNQTSDINIQALKSGVYFLSIEIGERVITKKLVVIKD